MADTLLIPTGSVTCRIVVASNDADDTGSAPDVIIPRGTLYLRPRKNAYSSRDGSAIVVPDVLSLPLDAEGWATVPDVGGAPTAERVIQIPTVEGMTWRASFDLTIPAYPWQPGVVENRLQIQPFDIPVEAGKTTNIVDYLPAGVDPSTGTVWVKGDQGDPGPGVSGATEQNGNLVLTLQDGTKLPPVKLPASTVPGPAPKLSVGQVTTGAPGSTASAAIRGQDGEYALDLTIPTGAEGPGGSGGATVSETPPPVVAGKLWYQPSTGTTFAAVDPGPAGVNLATNPSFEYPTPALVNLPTPMPASRVGSFNVFGAGVSGETTPWATRKTAVAAQVTASGATLIGLQELSNVVPDQAKDIADVLGAKWRSATGRTSGTLANGFLWDSTVWEPFTTPVTRALGGTDPIFRSVTFGGFKHIASGVMIWFGSAHLTGVSPAENRAQMRLIGQITQQLRNDTALEVMVAGDWVYKHDDPEVGGTMTEYGLTAMKVKGSPTLTRGDWNTFNNWDPTMNGRLFSSWLDHVYVTAGVAVDAAEVVATFAAGTALPLATPMASDHSMVAATVRVPQAMAVGLQRSAGAAITTGGGATAYRSFEWAKHGLTSLCIDPKGSTSSATAAYPIGASDAMARTNLVPGKTYTVNATLYLPQAQTGTLDSRARQFTIGLRRGTGTVDYSWKTSTQAPNVPGESQHSVTFTIPADATQCFVRLMNGSRVEKAFWDAEIISEGAARPYVDGDMAGARWALEPHLSETIIDGPTWVPLTAGKDA